MDSLGKGEMVTNRDVNTFVCNMFFMRMEHFWDLLFQLLNHGSNTLHFAFLFLFRIITRWRAVEIDFSQSVVVNPHFHLGNERTSILPPSVPETHL